MSVVVYRLPNGAVVGDPGFGTDKQSKGSTVHMFVQGVCTGSRHQEREGSVMQVSPTPAVLRGGSNPGSPMVDSQI